jgi:hypothetical protein
LNYLNACGQIEERRCDFIPFTVIIGMELQIFEMKGKMEFHSDLKMNQNAVLRRRRMQFFDSADWAMESVDANMNARGRRGCGGSGASAISQLVGYIENAEVSSGRDSPLIE